MNILGVCAGGGALLLPFRDQVIIANVEPRVVFHYPGEPTWKLNFGDVPFLREGLNPSWKPEVIVGSPDCGASSIMRLSKIKQLGDPKNNESINLVLSSIHLYKPKVFMIENLPKLVSILGKVWEEDFSDYVITTHTVSVMDFGNSQKSRNRSIIVGVRKDQPEGLQRAFRRIFRVAQPKRVYELLADYKDPENYNIPKKKTVAMYDYRLLPEKTNLTIRQICRLWRGDFQNEYKWPIKTPKMKTLPGVYRLKEDHYPLTVRPADRQFRPDGWPLGIKDFKRIMGFPEDFQVFIDPNNYLATLNKARYTLCKGSVCEVGIWFKDCLRGHLLKMK